MNSDSNKDQSNGKRNGKSWIHSDVAIHEGVAYNIKVNQIFIPI